MSSHANASLAPVPVSSLAEAVPAAVTEFARRLRWLGMDVSASEMADALRAISDADLLDRGQLRRRLQVTLVKRAADIPTFHGAFDLLFPALDLAGNDGSAAGPPVPDGLAGQAPDGEPVAPDLLARLVALLRGDPAASAGELAAEVIGAYGGLGPGQAAGAQRYYEYRIMRQLDLSTLLHRAMRLEGETPALRPAWERRLGHLEQEERMQELRAEIAAQLRDRLAESRGAEMSLHQLRESVLDADFLSATPGGACRHARDRAAARPAAGGNGPSPAAAEPFRQARRAKDHAPGDRHRRGARRARPGAGGAARARGCSSCATCRDPSPSSRSSRCPCCTRCTPNCPGCARSFSRTASPRSPTSSSRARE